MIKDQDYNDIIESYTKINGIQVNCIDVCIEMKNECERSMNGSIIPTYTQLKAVIKCDDADGYILDLLSKHNLFNVINKTFYRNGNILRIELKDAYYNRSLSNGRITFELSHSNDDNTIVDFY